MIVLISRKITGIIRNYFRGGFPYFMRTKNPKYYTYSSKKQLYEVRKTIKGKFHTFGYYHTEEEAQFIVEGLKKANWNPNHLEEEYLEFWEEKNKENPFKHIHKMKYDYSIDKNVNGEFIHYYSCKSLIQALMVRDLLIANDWDPLVVPKHQTATGEPYIYKSSKTDSFVIQKTINGQSVHFNTFKTLEDAILERELLIKYDWDMEKVCENEEEGLEEQWLNGKYSKGNNIYKYLNGRIDYDLSIY